MDVVVKRMKPVEIIGRMPEIETSGLGLRVIDLEMPLEKAEEIFTKLKRVGKSVHEAVRCVQFSIADLMNFIEETYGEAGYQCFDEKDWERSRNWRWVASKIPIEDRREEQCVTFDHYRFVTPLSPADREYYLSLVARTAISTRELQKQIDYDMGTRVIEQTDADERVFWKEYWDEQKCHYTKLIEAQERGVEAVKEELELARKVGFEEWIENYERDPDNEDKMPHMKFLECWIAAQQNT